MVKPSDPVPNLDSYEGCSKSFPLEVKEVTVLRGHSPLFVELGSNGLPVEYHPYRLRLILANNGDVETTVEAVKIKCDGDVKDRPFLRVPAYSSVQYKREFYTSELHEKGGSLRIEIIHTHGKSQMQFKVLPLKTRLKDFLDSYTVYPVEEERHRPIYEIDVLLKIEEHGKLKVTKLSNLLEVNRKTLMRKYLKPAYEKGKINFDPPLTKKRPGRRGRYVFLTSDGKKEVAEYQRLYPRHA